MRRGHASSAPSPIGANASMHAPTNRTPRHPHPPTQLPLSAAACHVVPSRPHPWALARPQQLLHDLLWAGPGWQQQHLRVQEALLPVLRPEQGVHARLAAALRHPVRVQLLRHQPAAGAQQHTHSESINHGGWWCQAVLALSLPSQVTHELELYYNQRVDTQQSRQASINSCPPAWRNPKQSAHDTTRRTRKELRISCRQRTTH